MLNKEKVLSLINDVWLYAAPCLGDSAELTKERDAMCEGIDLVFKAVSEMEEE